MAGLWPAECWWPMCTVPPVHGYELRTQGGCSLYLAACRAHAAELPGRRRIVRVVAL